MVPHCLYWKNEAAFILKRIVFDDIRLSCEGKAPEGWRTPKRWRAHLTHLWRAKRLGVRRPSAALARRHSFIPYMGRWPHAGVERAFGPADGGAELHGRLLVQRPEQLAAMFNILRQVVEWCRELLGMAMAATWQKRIWLDDIGGKCGWFRGLETIIRGDDYCLGRKGCGDDKTGGNQFDVIMHF
jgi:hypothetical protein